MSDDTVDRPSDLVPQASQQLSSRTSLVSRGLQDLTHLGTESIDWNQPTMTGWFSPDDTLEFLEHSNPKYDGTKIVSFRCEMRNISTGALRFSNDELTLYRSKNLSEVIQIDGVFLDSPIDLPPQMTVSTFLQFLQSNKPVFLYFAEGKPNQECLRDVLGDASEILAHDRTGKIIIILRAPGAHFLKESSDLLLQGRIEEACERCNTGLEISPLDAELWNSKGLLLAMQGENNEGLRCIDRALEIDPLNARYWANKCAPLENLSRHEEQLACWRRVIDLAPDYTNAWGNVGSCLFDLGRYDEAVQAFDSQLARTPLSDQCYLEKGIALKRLGRIDEAVSSYDRYLELKPDSVVGWKNKAIALLALERYEAAIDCCDRGLELECNQTQRCDLLSDKGVALRALKRFSEALECHDIALSRDADHLLSWLNKALSLAELGRYDEAVVCDDRALQIAPENPILWENKALHLISLGHQGEADACRTERCIRCSGTGNFRTSWGLDGICYTCGGTGVRKQP